MNEWITLAITWGIILLVGCVGHLLIYRLLMTLVQRTHSEIVRPFVLRAYRPAQWLAVTIFIGLSLPAFWPFSYEAVAEQALSLVMILLVAMTVMRCLDALRDILLMRFKMEDADNRRARMIHTQLNLFRRVAFVLICAVALGMALMTFESVRNLGSTLLASAGIVGVIVGVAAQRTLGTFIAGLQIAVTQPIRLDDVVIVEGEWGRIEEITLTYVVIRIWDQRRLIVPINHFIEKPFQNWTRISADLLGTVYFYVDYTVPTEPIREQLKTILEASPHWDQRVCVLQVTNATERTVELRALMSARNSSAAWDLRCEVREKLLAFIQQQYPEHLPKVRAELKGGSVQGDALAGTQCPCNTIATHRRSNMCIQFSCPHCSNRVQAPDDSAGKMSVCPQCKQGLVIPYKAVEKVPKQQEPDILSTPKEQRKIDPTVGEPGMSESGESQEKSNGDEK